MSVLFSYLSKWRNLKKKAFFFSYVLIFLLYRTNRQISLLNFREVISLFIYSKFEISFIDLSADFKKTISNHKGKGYSQPCDFDLRRLGAGLPRTSRICLFNNEKPCHFTLCACISNHVTLRSLSRRRMTYYVQDVFN